MAFCWHDGPPMSVHPAKPRVLVVDDAVYNRDLIVQNLEDDYQMLEAPDGVTGIAIARDQQPDLILMDLWLPGMDGYEATRRLRSDARTAWIPIVAVSAHAMAGAEERARSSGCDDYLPKPIDEEKLAAMVREWIVRGRERR
jgi:two-component system, cell cycle response regulator DivK